MSVRQSSSAGVESFVKAACAAAAIAMCVPALAGAQTPEHKVEADTNVKHVMVRVGGPEGAAGNVAFASFVEPDEAVAQAPYSADAVTEVTQTLADGNRINRRSVSKIYRDAAGRVRREQAISGVGPLGAAAEGVRFVFIQDPVAKTMYTLDPARQEARKIQTDHNVLVAHSPDAGASTGGERRIERKIVIAKGSADHLQVTDGDAGPLKHVEVFAGGGDPVAMPHGQGEPLGKRTIEGVEAEGTRWTRVIAAGTVGNERPIEVVTERWFSPEIKAVLLAKHNDPRLGETVYQLTNIVRQEPPADLFTVPADYKVVEGPGGGTVSTFKVVKPE